MEASVPSDVRKLVVHRFGIEYCSLRASETSADPKSVVIA